MDNRTVYLDNAATTYVSSEVLTEMLPVFTNIYGNASSLHSFGAEATKLVELARCRIAKAINANKSEIFFTSGGTESNNLAIFGIAKANINKGKHIMVSQIEHKSVLDSAKQLEAEGFEVTYIPVDKNGIVSVADIIHNIRPDTTLISVMMANNEVGTVQNIRAISNICETHNIYFHTDAVQAMGSININVKELKVDALSISAHKLYGPKGVGALYIKSGTPIQKQIFGGMQERNMRGGTYNVPGIVGMGKAVEVAVRDHNFVNQKLKFIRERFIKEVFEKIDGIKLNGHEVQRLVSNINISFEGIEGESLMLMLNSFGIAVSTGSACNSQSLEPSHVLQAMHVDLVKAHGSIRFSLGKNTSVEDMNYVLEKLVYCVEKLRAISPIRVKKPKAPKN